MTYCVWLIHGGGKNRQFNETVTVGNDGYFPSPYSHSKMLFSGSSRVTELIGWAHFFIWHYFCYLQFAEHSDLPPSDLCRYSWWQIRPSAFWHWWLNDLNDCLVFFLSIKKRREISEFFYPGMQWLFFLQNRNLWFLFNFNFSDSLCLIK